MPALMCLGGTGNDTVLEPWAQMCCLLARGRSARTGAQMPLAASRCSFHLLKLGMGAGRPVDQAELSAAAVEFLQGLNNGGQCSLPRF